MIRLPDPIRQLERLHEQWEERPAPAFDEHTTIQQLDALEVATRHPFYINALTEALPESDDYAQFLAKLTDSCITNDEIGRLAREMALKYVEACAQRRGESLTEFVS